MIALILVVTLTPLVSLAGCIVDTTYAYVGFWRAWEPSWCGAETENVVIHAFDVWGIDEESGKLLTAEHRVLDDTPEIRLLDFEQSITARRVLLLSTHGRDPLWHEPGMAVEYYVSSDSAWAAYNRYLGAGYAYDELDVGQTPSGAYVVVITNQGISNHLADRLEIFDGLIYGDYCYSYHTKDAWSVASFLGYEYGPDVDVVCENLDKVWDRLGCGAYPWHGHQTDDALRWDVAELQGYGNSV